MTLQSKALPMAMVGILLCVVGTACRDRRAQAELAQAQARLAQAVDMLENGKRGEVVYVNNERGPILDAAALRDLAQWLRKAEPLRPSPQSREFSGNILVWTQDGRGLSVDFTPTKYCLVGCRAWPATPNPWVDLHGPEPLEKFIARYASRD